MHTTTDGATPYTHSASGWLASPPVGWRRWLLRAPLLLWRLGGRPVIGQRLAVLTTIGRRSGRPHRAVVEYVLVNHCVVVASGWGGQADWVKNIEANPVVTVQTAGRTQGCAARRVTDRATLTVVYHAMRASPALAPTLYAWGVHPANLDELLAAADRSHFYMLEPISAAAPPPLPEDLRWLTLFAFVQLALLALGCVRRGRRCAG